MSGKITRRGLFRRVAEAGAVAAAIPLIPETPKAGEPVAEWLPPYNFTMASASDVIFVDEVASMPDSEYAAFLCRERLKRS